MAGGLFAIDRQYFKELGIAEENICLFFSRYLKSSLQRPDWLTNNAGVSWMGIALIHFYMLEGI